MLTTSRKANFSKSKFLIMELLTGRENEEGKG